MKRSTIKFILLTVLTLACAEWANAGQFAIVNATLTPVTQPMIENGTLIIEGDRITALGRDIPIPEGAEIIDAQGLFVYPGMIDASSVLGLYEVSSVASTVDMTEMGKFNPHIRASTAIHPHSVHIPVTRINGVTSAVVVPRGEVITGQCAFINLNGWTPGQMVMKDPVAMHINFPEQPNPNSGRRRRRQQTEKATPERTKKQIQELKDLFGRAKRYAEAWDAYDAHSKNPAPVHDLVLEALVPVIKKEVPVFILAQAEKDIQNAVAFIEEFELKAVLEGVNDGWKVADFLAEKEIPVVIGPVLRSPGSKDPYDARYANAGVLHKAGVKIAFLSGSAADARSLPYQAGSAAAYGLPKEAALKAVTIFPAEIFGLADQLGSLEAGKLANVIITDGDPLEMRTQVKQVFIAGEKIPMTSKHIELYETFKDRPAPTK